MKKSYLRRLMSLLLALIMVITVMPIGAITAFSAETIKGEVETIFKENSSSQRKTILNQGWKFNMSTADCSAPTYNDSSWLGISLPHDFSITQSFSSSNEGESGFLPGGTGWYRKKIVIPSENSGKRFELNFDGSYMHTYVYINGELVGENHYGYNSFAFDITDKLICDGLSENTISVKVVHNTPSSRWYSGSGIYRDVSLIMTEPVHIAHNGLTITTPNISSGNGTVNAVARVQNQTSSAQNVSVMATIYEKNSDEAVASAVSSSTTVSAGATSNVTVTPVVSSPKLWSVETPNLYRAKIDVYIDGAIVDTYEDSFGFRYFSWSRTNGFSLNGERVQLQGVCMHHDQGALGSAAYHDAMYRQMKNMKDMGVNSIRATHNPYSEDFYKICDELGLLVIEELFDGWAWNKNSNTNDFSTQWNVNLTASNTIIGGNSSMKWPEFVVKEVCQRDVNRACVFMWSLCNELTQGTSGVTDSAAADNCTNIINWIKTVDNTRKVTSGDNDLRYGSGPYIAYERVITNNGGIVGLNYAKGSEYNTLYSRYPTWTYYGSETTSTTNTRAMYKGIDSNVSVDGRLHLTSYDTSAVGWGTTSCDSMLNTYTHSYVAGEYRWTGWDYIGEPTPWNGVTPGTVSGGVGATPNSSYFGIVDTAGFEKDTYYLYRSLWKDDKDDVTTHLVTAWDSENYYISNGKTPVFIYSNAYKVELYLRKKGASNDTLMGTATRKDTVNDVGTRYHQYNTASNNSSECTATPMNASSGTSLYARFDLAYTDGTLFTKSYDENGRLIDNSDITGNHTVTTAGNVSKIKLTADKTEILADGQSLAYFTVDLLDSNDVPVTTGENQIKFDITGNGEIMGVDNGDEATTAKFQQSSVIDISNRTTAKINAWGGKALVIVRSTKNAGSFTISASSNGLSTQSCTVETKAQGTVEPQDGDIESYSLIRNYTVKAGSSPTFDTSATATVVGSDEILNGKIKWNSVPEGIYSVPGDYIINGFITFDGYPTIPVTCVLHVIDTIASAQNISTQTIQNEIPQLPEFVVGLSSKGESAGQFEVEWQDLEASSFSKVGEIVEVDGTVAYFDSETLPVKAFVRVVKPSIVKTSDITNTAYIKSDVADGDLSALRDGNLTALAWTNEDNSTVSETAYIDYRWDTAVLLSSIDIAYNINGKAVQPEDVDIQFSTNNVSYESIGFTGPLEDLHNGKLYTYHLDRSINPIAIRIIFTQQRRTTGDNCVGVNEIKLNTEKKTLPEANSSADLSTVMINGERVDDFDATKLYHSEIELEDGDAVTAVGKDNSAVTVLPMLNGCVKIITISEDGNNSKTYVLGDCFVPDVTSEAYKFDFKNSTPTSLETGSSLKALTDNAGHTLNYMLWQESSVSSGQYLKLQDAFVNTPSTIDTGIKGDCWNAVFKYNKTTDDKPNATLIGLGTAGGAGSMADLVYITADGYIEVGFNDSAPNQSTPVGKNLYNKSASAPEVLDIGYDNGIVTVKYNNEAVFTKDISSNAELNAKFKNGVGSFFIGANKYVSSGGAYSDNSHNSSGQASYIQRVYDLTGTVTVKGSGPDPGEYELENIAPNATITTNAENGSTGILVDGNKEFSKDNNALFNWTVRQQGQMTVTLAWDEVYSFDSVNLAFFGEGWGTFPPKQLDIYASADGTSFDSTPIMTIVNDGENMPSVSSIAGVYEKSYSLPADTQAKALKIVATVRDGSISSGKFATGYAEIEVIAKKPQENPDPGELNTDTTALDQAMADFESRVSSGKVYKNIYNAYHAYVECQRARDAVKYGLDATISLDEKTSALITATNALTEWEMTMPTDASKISARFSSYDNATNNKQYFKNALYITNSDDPYAVSNNPGHAWFGVYYHNGTYIYDGENDIEVPVMLMIIPYRDPYYMYSAYLTGQNSAVSLKGNWFGSDGPGNGEARKYYYYHDEDVLKANSVDYYNRRFNIPSTSSYSASQFANLSGKNNWNLATTNAFTIDGAELFKSNSNAVSADVDFGSINIHSYTNTTASSPWKNTYSLGSRVKVINQKGLRDRAQAYALMLKDVSSYKENGLNWAMDGVSRFAGIDYNITSQSAGTLTADMQSAHNSLNQADTSTAVDSSAYALLRTALDNATIIKNDDCYDSEKFAEYISARCFAIDAMKNVGKNGYTATYKNVDISTIASSLSSSLNEMQNGARVHTYSNGLYNPSTKEIMYKCEVNEQHEATYVSIEGYLAGVEMLKASIENTAEIKPQAIKNCLAEIEENDYYSLIPDGIVVKKAVTQQDADSITAKILDLNTRLNARININRVDIRYVYTKDDKSLAEGLIADARYGDWLDYGDYTLKENEQVYKWILQADDGDFKIPNLSVSYNTLATENMSLVCYIEDDQQAIAQANFKLTFVNRIDRVAGIRFIDKNNAKLLVEDNAIKNSNGDILFKPDKIPFYQVIGFDIAGTAYQNGDQATISDNQQIKPIYSPIA